MGGLPLDASVLRRGQLCLLSSAGPGSALEIVRLSAPHGGNAHAAEMQPLPTTTLPRVLSYGHAPRGGSKSRRHQITAFGHPGTTLLRVVKRPPSTSCSLRGATPTGSTPRMGSLRSRSRRSRAAPRVCTAFSSPALQRYFLTPALTKP